MNRCGYITFILLVGEMLFSCKKDNAIADPVVPIPPDTPVIIIEAKPVVKTNAQKLYVHYMPWFETPATSDNGKWGQHWTMANKNPDNIAIGGQREIASYFYPLIGPYASSDPDLIDYHTLLMKYSGIDGVIVDWYGVHNVYDYPLIKRNTDSLFSRIPKVGLQMSICYEDATLRNVKSIAGIDTVQAASEDFAFLQSQYFNSSNYIKIDNRPLLLDFGPQVMKSAINWQQAFSSLSNKPILLSLAYQGEVTGSSGNGEFSWVQADNLVGQQIFCQNRAPGLPYAFACAYPGFKDFYGPGGWGSPLFVIDHNGTSTLQSSLDLAKKSQLLYLQLATWNDFGEGTMLEPTAEYSFAFLQTIQQYSGVVYSKIELELIYRWYTLRKKYKSDKSVERRLSQAYYYLVSLDIPSATAIVSAIP